MKKTAKTLLATLLALTMLCALALPVWAADTTENLGTHKFEAFQIFTGDVADVGGKNVLSNVKPGHNVPATILDDLKKDATLNLSTATDLTDAIKQISSFTDDQMVTLARFFYKKKTGTAFATSNSNSFDVTAGGYYLIVDTTAYNNPSDSHHAKNFSVLYLARAGEKITVKSKVVKPTVEKKVQTNNDLDNPTWGTSADHAVDEPFLFKLTATLPATDAYKYYTQYSVAFSDKWSDGIVFDELVSVKANSNPLTKDNDYEFYDAKATSDKFFTLTINDVKAIRSVADVMELTGVDIEVVYKAHLDTKADFSGKHSTATTNKNTVTLSYPGDPNDTDMSGYAFPGVTPKSVAYVASYKVENIKYKDEATAGHELKDAGFTLYDSTGTTPIKLKKDATDKYYYPSTATGATAEIFSADDGTFHIKGLDAGTYWLKETTTPAGYNTCKPIEIKIIATLTNDTVNLTGSTNMLNEIVDYSGVVLPSTGGMGTTIFYVVGGLLMVGAAVLLVTKKRMQKN